MLLLTLAEQFHNVTWLGNLGEIDLGFNIRLRRFFSGGRARPGREILPYLLRFIFFNRA
jgi:hypothetical protein